jgi:hypothetical protein
MPYASDEVEKIEFLTTHEDGTTGLVVRTKDGRRIKIPMNGSPGPQGPPGNNADVVNLRPATMLATRPLLLDGFQRPDENIRGSKAETGQPWMFVSGGGASDANIVNGRMKQLSPTTSPPTAYGRVAERVGEIAMGTIDNGDGDGSVQHVVGVTGTVFGGTAIQLGWAGSKSNWGTVDGLLHHWCLFGSLGGGAGKIAWGDFAADIPDDDGKLRIASMLRIGLNTVILRLPNGTFVPVTDVAIAASWGTSCGFQQRMITTGAGTFDFVAVAVGARLQLPPSAAPITATGIHLPGITSSDVTGIESYFPQPVSQDHDWRFKFRRPALGTACDIFTRRATRTGGVVPAQSAWRIFMTATDNLDLGVSVDGTTLVNKGYSAGALGLLAATWFEGRITRTGSDGSIRLYNTPDNGVTWNQVSAALTGAPSGALAQSKEPVRIGSVDTVVGSPNPPFEGDIAYFEERDGIGGTILGRWEPKKQIDDFGNTWWITGKDWNWI